MYNEGQGWDKGEDKTALSHVEDKIHPEFRRKYLFSLHKYSKKGFRLVLYFLRLHIPLTHLRLA